MKIDQRTSLFVLHQERVLYRVVKLGVDITPEPTGRPDEDVEASGTTIIGEQRLELSARGSTPWDAIEQLFEMIRELHRTANARPGAVS